MLLAEILLVDDHRLFRNVITEQLTLFGHSVYTAANGEEALVCVGKHSIDLILLDVQMPVMNGIDFLQRLRTFDKQVKVVVLTGLDDESLVLHMLGLGANSFLRKNCEVDELQRVIGQTLEDGECITSEIAIAMEKGRSEPEAIANLFLSPRERQILQLLQAGRSSKEIANALDLAVYTVDSYRKALMEKTRAKSLGSLIGLAMRTGIVN